MRKIMFVTCILMLVCLMNLAFGQVDTCWVRTYNGPGNGGDYATAIAADVSGNIAVTGWSLGVGTSFDYCTIKYNTDGDTIWVRRHTGPSSYQDRPYAVTMDDFGNVYVTGFEFDFADDYCTIKYNLAGDVEWIARYNGPANGSDDANALAVDNDGYVYVTGRSFISSTNDDYATIKYRQGPGVIEGGELQLSDVKFRVEPSIIRSGQRLRVKFSLNNQVNVKIDLFDATGRKVKMIMQENFSAGEHYFMVDVQNNKSAELQLKSGVYFVRFQTSGTIEAIKIILVM